MGESPFHVALENVLDLVVQAYVSSSSASTTQKKTSGKAVDDANEEEDDDEEEERQVELLRSEVALLVSAAMERVGVKPARVSGASAVALSERERERQADLTRPATTEDENDYVMIATSFFLA